MRVSFISKQMPVTEAIGDYVKKKVSKLEKYFPGEELDISVTFSVQKSFFTVEIMVYNKGIYIKGLDKSDDMYSSIDIAVDKIEKQVNRYKTRINERRYDENKKEKMRMDVYSSSSIETSKPKLVLTKEFDAKPMLVEEAVMQMNLLNKQFFVFHNAEDGQINIVYNRDDGDIGLIEP